jgi:precorrin-6A/cobalt-precorrin-6A reductase
MGDRLWLIGGTQDSKALAQQLVAAQIPCVVTVTTESARSLYPDAPTLTCCVGALQAEEFPQFLQTYSVGAILDASHPFAVEISQRAIALAQAHRLPYLRYERPQVTPCSDQDTGSESVDSVEALLASGSLAGERVLLTLGYRLLPLFKAYQSQAVLFARILPSVAALEGAIASGFTPDRLIALRPPISLDLERALWQQWKISVVVTKASGVAGGEDQKRHLASELGIRCVAIARPVLNYPQCTSDFTTALAFCQQLYHQNHQI